MLGKKISFKILKILLFTFVIFFGFLTFPLKSFASHNTPLTTDGLVTLKCDLDGVQIDWSLAMNPANAERIRVEYEEVRPGDSIGGRFNAGDYQSRVLAAKSDPISPNGPPGVGDTGSLTTKLSANNYKTFLTGFTVEKEYRFRLIIHRNYEGRHRGFLTEPYTGYPGIDRGPGDSEAGNHTRPNPSTFDGGREYSAAHPVTFTYCAPVPPVFGSDPANLCELANYLGRILGIVSAAFGFGFFIMIVVGGFRYLTSGGDAKAAESARRVMTYALLGLIMMFVAWIILLVIDLIFNPNPSILKFNFCVLLF